MPWPRWTINILEIKFKKLFFILCFHFYVASIFKQFQFDFRFDFKLPEVSRRTIRRHSSIPWPRLTMKILKLIFSCLTA